MPRWYLFPVAVGILAMAALLLGVVAGDPVLVVRGLVGTLGVAALLLGFDPALFVFGHLRPLGVAALLLGLLRELTLSLGLLGVRGMAALLIGVVGSASSRNRGPASSCPLMPCVAARDRARAASNGGHKGGALRMLSPVQGAETTAKPVRRCL